jgi:IS1 family transposase
LIWVISAYCRESKRIVRLSVGSRTNKTLNRVLISLQLSEAQKVYTDQLKHYRFLIEKNIHKTKSRMTNHLERMHLNLRTHLKRLNRRSIGFSRSVVMLISILKIYLWR